jgi:hypothetical protein
MRLRGGGLSIVCAVLVALLGAALAPAFAAAASVENGSFETGSLSGWHETSEAAVGDWFAYRGTAPPLGSGRGVTTVPAPPQGRFAAITDQQAPDTVTLWQDVALEPEATHVLSLQAFYQSQFDPHTPSPDTLSTSAADIGEQANEQFRIDVMKPTAPLDSIAPEDILATVFATETGSPRQMESTRFSADLSAFAGQTVRIRAVVVNQFDSTVAAKQENLLGVFNAGVDNVAITSAGPGVKSSEPKKGGAGASGHIQFGHPRPNRHSGTLVLPVEVPSAGLLQAKSKWIRTATAHPQGATTVKLRIKPTQACRARLLGRHRLPVKLTIAWNAAGTGGNEARTTHVVLQLAPRHHARRAGHRR